VTLRVADAHFVRGGVALVRPFSLALEAGDTAELAQPSPHAASVAARICAGIVKPTAGAVFVGEYETRLQPPQAKRRVGFVDAAGFAGDDHALRCELAFRAEVWGLVRADAERRAAQIFAALDSAAAHPYARGLALALVAPVTVVVLDRPPAAFADRVRALVPDAVLVRTTT
jgi:ABC-type Na+ transport system ATPase subunit NatA